MTERISSYIIAEKQESLLFMAVGVLAICVALWLWVNGHRLKAMAYPLLGLDLFAEKRGQDYLEAILALPG